LDKSRWNFDIGDGSSHGLIGWGNQELEYYTDLNYELGKSLIISAKKLSASEKLSQGLSCYYGPAEWTSTRIHTAGKVGFHLGYIELRAKMPEGIGTWPALWMLGSSINTGISWPECGEIDILENTGANPRRVQGSIHGPGYFAEKAITKIIEDSIEWFFNGISYHRVERQALKESGLEWPFDKEFFLLINLAIGGGFAGSVDPGLSVAQLEVAWIKHFRVDGIGSVKLY
jgi:beta-glucanase (GH16 family)